jgi:hypothetical protein
MHTAMHLFLFWGIGFATLLIALLLTNIYCTLIANDLTLRSTGQEAVIAAIASLVEGGSVWAVLAYAPGAGRALFIPALVVAIIYKCSHLEDWSYYDVSLLLAFQLIIAWSGALLLSGHIRELMIVWLVFGAVLALVSSFATSL